MPVHLTILLCGALLLPGCVGYQLGGIKPPKLAEVERLSIPLVKNQTQLPRASAHATNALIDALTSDGTYRVSPVDRADARLEVTLDEIKYRQARSTRRDVLRSEELEMEVILKWQVIDATNPTAILAQGNSYGKTLFFVDPNLQTARQTALSDALKRASESLVSQIADGY